MEFLASSSISESITYLGNYMGLKTPLNFVNAAVEISIVSYVIYKIIHLAKETRAIQLIKGILVILVVYYLSSLLQLRTIEFVLKNTLQIGIIALVVLFQPELRRALEQIGRSNFRDFINLEERATEVQTATFVEEIVKAATEMSKTYTGALIVVERETRVGDIVNTGVQLDSNVSAELLINIFTPNTPLHDGAVVIRTNKILAAACFLPLTDNPNLSKELGTRHRAALGITEVSDAIAIIVSEETGKISFALNGGLTRNLTPDILRKALSKNLMDKNSHGKKLTLWKGKSK